MLDNVIFKFIKVWIILSYMFKGTIFEIEVWGEDGNINMVTHAKLEIIVHNYAIVYIIILRHNFSIYVVFFCG